jgi:hypothetical protein
MTEVSLPRLYALRLGYLILGGGLVLVKWPTLVSHSPTWPLFEGVSSSLFGAMALLALLGLRYPLQMLPVILIDLVWKIIWAVLVWLPLWQSNQIDEATATAAVNCLVVLTLIPLIPWDYVFAHYVRAPGAPWSRAMPKPAAATQ